QQAERRARNLEVIQRVSTSLNSTLDVDKILALVCQAAVDLIKADHSGLVLFDAPHYERGRVTAEYPPIGTNGIEIQVKGVALEERLIARREPIVLSEITDKAALGPVGAVFERFDIRSILIVPMVLQERVIGSFSLDAIGRTRHFTSEEVELCQTFANQVAIAVGNSEAHKAVKHYAAQLDVLHKISDYIQASQDLDRILHVVLTGVTAGYGLGFNRAALFLLDESRENLVGRMGIGHIDPAAAHADWEQAVAEGLPDFAQFLSALEGDQLPSTPINDHTRRLQLPVDPIGGDVFSQAVLQGNYVLLTETSPQSVPAAFVEAFKPARPLIVVPLWARDQPIGVLVADNKFTRAGINEAEIELILTFANTAAIAIDNTRLLHETRVATERLSSFFEASNALVLSHDSDKVLRDILELACVAADANGASLILSDPLRQVSVGTDEQVDIKDVIRPKGLSMKVMQTGHYAVIEDVAKEQHRINPSVFSPNIKAALCFPVAVEGQRIGVMWIHYNQPRRFAKAEVEALQLYVNQAAIAFDSARRIKELEYMRRAAEALAGVASLQDVLKQIVCSAREVLHADSAVILPYDAAQNRFLREKAVADGITLDSWNLFQKVEPRQGGTAHTIMETAWVGVKNVSDRENYHFLGKTTHRFLEQIKAQSFQGISLRVGGESLGVLYVNFENRRDFSDREYEAAVLFANHAALALRNAKLLEQVRQTRNAARAVAEVTVVGDLASTLKAIVTQTQDILGADVVTLYPFDPETDDFDFPQTMIGVRYSHKISAAGQSRQSTIHRILALDRLHIAENRGADAIMNDTFAKSEGIRSSVGLPLTVRSIKVGVLIVSYRSPHSFTDDELNNIKLFANQAAVAIRNAQLFKRIEKRVRIQETLYEAGQALNSTLDSGQVLSIIVRQACQLTGGTRSSHLARLNHRQLQFVAAYPPNHLERLKQSIGNIDLSQNGRIGIVGLTATRQKSHLVNDVTLNEHYIRYDPETRSEIAVPIKSGARVIGVIDVEDHRYHAFDNEHLRALEALADQASVAIQNAALFEETQRKAKLLSTAAQVARHTTAILEIDKLLTETGRLITGSFGFYHTGVFLFDKKRERLELQAVYPANRARLNGGYSLAVGQGIIGTVAQSGQAHLAPDVSRDLHYIPTLPLTRAEMAFPLMVRGEVIGVLDVQSTSFGDWGDEDVATLQIMADQLANAIINAQLYQDTTEQLKEANILRQVAVSLAGTSELSEVLKLVLTEAIRLTDTYEGGVLFWDAQQEEITHGFKVNVHQGLQLYSPQVRTNGLTRKIIEQRKPVIIVDTQQNTQANPVLSQQGYRALLGVPLLSQNDAIGALCVRSKSPKHFSEREIALLEILAGQFAVAIDRARQYEEMKQIKGFIGTHTAVDWIRMVSTTWGHNIKREVGTAKGHVAWLKTLLPKAQQTAEIEQQLEQLDAVINGIKDIPITAPLSYEDAINSLRINETIRTYLERRWRQIRYQAVALQLNLATDLDNVATVRASQEWLRRGFELIIDNAVHAMELANSPEQQITLTTRLIDRKIEVLIEDTGPGIPESLRTKLFKQPVDKPEGSKGSGIGLMLAKTIFQTYRGDIDIDTTTDRGTTVVITLPVETTVIDRPKVSAH
ncbi:MAG: GAF domain-containing protein, partial [Anaerolineae bacterium]|nr:GAF domain-containing protein [Anaerolineae bacterium]